MKDKTPHWNERDLTKGIECEDGTYYPLTKRAWDERIAYALERVGELDGITFNSDGTTHKSKGKSRPTREQQLERYKDIVMIRTSDGYSEPLVTPSDFGKKWNISPQGISGFLGNPDRKQVQGWTIKGR